MTSSHALISRSLCTRADQRHTIKAVHTRARERKGLQSSCTHVSTSALTSKHQKQSKRCKRPGKKNQNHLAAHLFSPTIKQPIEVIPTYTYIHQKLHPPIPKLSSSALQSVKSVCSRPAKQSKSTVPITWLLYAVRLITFSSRLAPPARATEQRTQKAASSWPSCVV